MMKQKILQKKYHFKRKKFIFKKLREVEEYRDGLELKYKNKKN